MDNYKLIDMHTHILPQVDDGASSMEDTMQMLKMAKEQGIRTIIATPHYGADMKEKSTIELKEIISKVQIEAAVIDPDMKLLMGNELYYSDSSLEEVKAGKALTLAGSRYVLIEFSVAVKYKTIYQGLRQFTLAGYAPVLAHVERYRCLMEEESRILELIELGVYIQMNSSSLEGSLFSKSLAQHKRLIKNRWVHMIATDCHNSTSRAPLLHKAFQTVVKLTDLDYAKELFCLNPGKILENKYI
jgi:protein-tyrosine phosphatase